MHQRFNDLTLFIKGKFADQDFIPLHAPCFLGNEKKYVEECINSTFVSSVGEFVDLFEKKIVEYTGAKYAVATVNGTSALHIALMMAGVIKDDIVVTQPLSFIATCNAISYISAMPLFIDIDKSTLGLSPEKFADFLLNTTYIGDDGYCYHKILHKRISACVPMHTFGHPVEMNQLLSLCKSYNIALVEDAAESMGSFYHQKHTGTLGLAGTFSFNGNKTITSGGGGMLITNDASVAIRAKHITTQAKVPHKWEFVHDQIGYNYRLPNINAALACAQLEQLELFVQNKRELAFAYQQFFEANGIDFISEPLDCRSNYWLNAVVLKDLKERDEFLTLTNNIGVMTRPVWGLMNSLTMFENCPKDDLSNAHWAADRIVNIPSSVFINQ